MVQYQQNEQFKVHIDCYDLIVLAISGSIIIQSSGNTTLALPEHQYAYIPAGVSHGFKATSDGPVRLYLSKSIDFILHRFALSCNTQLALEGKSCIKKSVCRFV